MSRFRFWGAILGVAVGAALLFTLGCGGSDKPKESPKPAASTGDKKGEDSSAKAKAGGEKTAVEAKGVATLKGKVTYDGDPPVRRDLTPQIEAQQDKDHCKKGDTKDPLWIVDTKDKGVANVVVWLRPPEGKYFKVPADHRMSMQNVEMNQPYCAFTPHVVAINPTVWDPDAKEQKPSGQTFKILNSAPINHNTAWIGNKLFNTGANQILKPKGALEVNAKSGLPSQVGGEDLLNVSCDIHKWMTAKVAVFDHPYYAVTDLNGNYEIKNAPAGSEVTLAYWHESFGGGSLKKEAKTKTVTLKAGDNVENFSIK